jgi:sensor histidine kinase YesM
LTELQGDPQTIKHLRDANGQLYMVNVSEIPELGMSILRPVPEKQFLEDLEKRMNRSVFSILAVFSVGILIFVLFLIRFTSPIAALLRSMKQVGAGDFRTSVHVKGNDEIALLGNNFNRMVTRLSELVKRLEEEQRLKEEANFQSLQAQINPHFLFNTLNSIKLMAMLSNTNRNVSNMITALGKLLEFSMKFNQRFVTLGQELEYLELYMALQKIRFQDLIDIEARVPEELKEMYVLKFSLQPLVENSIVHGGKLPLHIAIHAEAEDGELRVFIRDDGNGVTEEQLAEIMDRLEQSHAQYSGIGISNVDRRIRLYFGTGYGVTLRRVDSGGLEAIITFPLRKEAP